MSEDNVIQFVPGLRPYKHTIPLAQELAAESMANAGAQDAAYAAYLAGLADTAPSEWVADSGDCA